MLLKKPSALQTYIIAQIIPLLLIQNDFRFLDSEAWIQGNIKKQTNKQEAYTMAFGQNVASCDS